MLRQRAQRGSYGDKARVFGAHEGARAVRLVCLPGLGNTPAVFDPLFDALSGTVLQGGLYGLSLVDTRLTSFADLLAHARAQLSPLMGPPITLLGYSMGGYVAQSLALDPPAGAKIARLILVNTRAGNDEAPEAEERARTLRLLASAKARYQGVGPKMFRALVGPTARDDQAMAAFVKAMALVVGRGGLIAQLRALQSRPDFRPRLPELSLPTLIIAGDQDQRTPLKQSQDMAHAIPTARLEVLEGCGHIAPLERPAELAALVESFSGRAL